LRAAALAAFGEPVQIAESFRDDMPIPRIAAHNVRRAVLAHVATAQAGAGMTAEALHRAVRRGAGLLQRAGIGIGPHPGPRRGR
jgi:hypothetical protein